jgi:hypothetical protein
VGSSDARQSKARNYGVSTVLPTGLFRKVAIAGLVSFLNTRKGKLIFLRKEYIMVPKSLPVLRQRPK